MLGTNNAPGDWYPMWSFSNNFTTDTPGGVAWTKIGELKHAELPKVVMAKTLTVHGIHTWINTMHVIHRISWVNYRPSLIKD